jgi:hypothetical protein
MPFSEARTTRIEESRQITLEDIERTIQKARETYRMEAQRVFLGSWAAGLSDEEVIEYFKDNGGVIVVDRHGRQWCRGKEVIAHGQVYV